MIAKLTPVSLALVCAVALSGASCEPSDVAYYTALLKGQPPTAEQVEQFFADTPAALELSSSEEVVTVAVVEAAAVPEPSVEPEPAYVPPEPEPCLPVQWRGNWYSCDMKVLIGPVE